MALKKKSHNVYVWVESYIFDHEFTLLNKETDKLIELNAKNEGQSPQGFVFKSNIYRSSKAVGGLVLPRSIGNLEDPYIRERADILMQRKIQYMKDRTQVRQVLSFAIRCCHSNQHLRDLLPDSVIPATPVEVQHLSRIAPVGFILLQQNDQFKYDQYMKVIECIDGYLVNKMLFP